MPEIISIQTEGQPTHFLSKYVERNKQMINLQEEAKKYLLDNKDMPDGFPKRYMFQLSNLTVLSIDEKFWLLLALDKLFQDDVLLLFKELEKILPDDCELKSGNMLHSYTRAILGQSIFNRLEYTYGYLNHVHDYPEAEQLLIDFIEGVINAD